MDREPDLARRMEIESCEGLRSGSMLEVTTALAFRAVPMPALRLQPAAGAPNLRRARARTRGARGARGARGCRSRASGPTRSRATPRAGAEVALQRQPVWPRGCPPAPSGLGRSDRPRRPTPGARGYTHDRWSAPEPGPPTPPARLPRPDRDRLRRRPLATPRATLGDLVLVEDRGAPQHSGIHARRTPIGSSPTPGPLRRLELGVEPEPAGQPSRPRSSTQPLSPARLSPPPLSRLPLGG